MSDVPKTIIGGVFYGNRERQRQMLKLNRRAAGKRKAEKNEIYQKTEAFKRKFFRYWSGKYVTKQREAFLKQWTKSLKVLKKDYA